MSDTKQKSGSFVEGKGKKDAVKRKSAFSLFGSSSKFSKENNNSEPPRPIKVLVVYYSLYGGVHQLAKTIVEGAKSVGGDIEVTIKRIAETRTNLDSNATDAQKKMSKEVEAIQGPEELEAYDIIFFGTSTRFGSASEQLSSFLHSSDKLWTSGALVSKVGSVFVCGIRGQESAVSSIQAELTELGMVAISLPYNMQEKIGFSNEGTGKEEQPSSVQLQKAKAQGKHVTQIGVQLINGIRGVNPDTPSISSMVMPTKEEKTEEMKEEKKTEKKESKKEEAKKEEKKEEKKEKKS